MRKTCAQIVDTVVKVRGRVHLFYSQDIANEQYGAHKLATSTHFTHTIHTVFPTAKNSIFNLLDRQLSTLSTGPINTITKEIERI